MLASMASKRRLRMPLRALQAQNVVLQCDTGGWGHTWRPSKIGATEACTPGACHVEASGSCITGETVAQTSPLAEETVLNGGRGLK